MIQQLTDAGDQFKQPVLTVEMVSEAVVRQIIQQKSGQVILPGRLTFISLIRAFPSWLQERARVIGSKDLFNLRKSQALLEQK